MRRRLAGGLRANSKPSDGPSAKDFTETMEAELVFLLRTARNSWLSHQVEIHFHDLADQYRRQALRGAEWLLASLVCNGFH